MEPDLDEEPLVLFSFDEEGVPVYVASNPDTVRELVQLDFEVEEDSTSPFQPLDLDAVFDALVSEAD